MSKGQDDGLDVFGGRCKIAGKLYKTVCTHCSGPRARIIVLTSGSAFLTTGRYECTDNNGQGCTTQNGKKDPAIYTTVSAGCDG
jgi:hypothetical protein